MSANAYAEAKTIMQSKTTEWLQWLMVIAVLGATVFIAVKNNDTDIIFNLCTLCFGYYFGSKQSDLPVKPA